jgi:carbon-monoxide dehydrogenase large subunit
MNPEKTPVEKTPAEKIFVGKQVGKAVRRIEDKALLQGKGRYIDDIHLPNMLEACFVRSSQAHAFIKSVDTKAGLAVPGVHAILTIDDLRPYLKQTDHTPERVPSHWPLPPHDDDITPLVLADKETVFAGEAIAIVIADNRYAAEDAAMMVEIDYEILPPVWDCKQGLLPDAPRADTRRASNKFFEIKQSYGDIEQAFANADHQLTINLKQQRGGPHPIEGRGIVASYDAGEDFLTVWTSSQHVHQSHSGLLVLLGLDENQVRMVAPDIGGGFGAKYDLYPEEVAVAIASLMMARPIKWIEDRREEFIATIQEHDQYWDIDVAYNSDGRMMGARGKVTHDQGAYMPHGLGVAQTCSTVFPNVYNLPAFQLSVQMVQTNKVATMAVRGAGHPQAIFAVEHSLDLIAKKLGLDRAEVRRRNLIRADQMPFARPIKARSGVAMVFDSGDFPEAQRKALAAIDYEGFPERQKKARAQGRYLGLGIANGIKGCGRGPYESAVVRVGRTGNISVYTGAAAIGQGIQTAFAQICAEQLGVETSEVTVKTSDTATITMSLGAFNSRQTIMAGSAVHMAALEVRQKALNVAAHLLEVSVDDLQLRDGRVEISGIPGSGVSLAKIADVLAGAPGYPIPGGFTPHLESTQTFSNVQMTFGIGSHAVEAEVDIDTGHVKLLRYVAVHDVGQPINPMTVDGQIVGGIVHGIGNALFEWMGYDKNAQPFTTTLAEYLLPTAPDVPYIEHIEDNHRSLTNPIGVKGVGESGTATAVAAVVSAIENALESFDIEITEVPVSPQHIFDLLRGASKAN